MIYDFSTNIETLIADFYTIQLLKCVLISPKLDLENTLNKIEIELKVRLKTIIINALAKSINDIITYDKSFTNIFEIRMMYETDSELINYHKNTDKYIKLCNNLENYSIDSLCNYMHNNGSFLIDYCKLNLMEILDTKKYALSYLDLLDYCSVDLKEWIKINESFILNKNKKQAFKFIENYAFKLNVVTNRFDLFSHKDFDFTEHNLKETMINFPIGTVPGDFKITSNFINDISNLPTKCNSLIINSDSLIEFNNKSSNVSTVNLDLSNSQNLVTVENITVNNLKLNCNSNLKTIKNVTCKNLTCNYCYELESIVDSKFDNFVTSFCEKLIR